MHIAAQFVLRCILSLFQKILYDWPTYTTPQIDALNPDTTAMPPKKSRGGRRRGAKKKETKKDSNTTPMKWCYPDCMLDRIEAESMIQCHICQLWAHALCINEGENDIVGIWCCRNCRKLPETTEMLCDKIDDLQRDMAVLLKFVHSFRHTVPTVTVLDNDLSDDRSDSHDQTISLIGTPPTSIVMPTNNPVVDRQPPENNNTETENNNSPPIVPDDSDAQHVKTYRLKAAGPAKPIHDVFIGGLDYNTTEDEVRACLMDFNIENIRKVEKLETSGSENSSSFHVIINDISIKESVYGNDMFPPGVIVKPYRYYKSHTSYNHKTSPSTRQSSSILRHPKYKSYQNHESYSTQYNNAPKNGYHHHRKIPDQNSTQQHSYIQQHNPTPPVSTHLQYGTAKVQQDNITQLSPHHVNPSRSNDMHTHVDNVRNLPYPVEDQYTSASLAHLPYPINNNNMHYRPTYVAPLEQPAYPNQHQHNLDNMRNVYPTTQTAPHNVQSAQALYPHNNQSIQFNQSNLQSQQF